MNRIKILIIALAAVVVALPVILIGSCGGGEAPVDNDDDTDGAATDDDDLNDDDFVDDDDIWDGKYSAKISLNVESLAFDGIAPGEETDMPFIIENTGSTVLTIKEITLDENLTQDFASNFNNNLTQRIEPGAQLEVRITYAPKDTEDDRGFLTIVSDATNETQTDELGNALTSLRVISRYVGLSAVELVLPSDKIDEDGRLNFGYVEPAKTNSIAAKIRNVGSGNAVLDFFPFEYESEISQRAFRIEPMIPEALSNYEATGSEADIELFFEPLNREGAFTDTITVRTNAPGEPPVIRVVGTSMKEGRLLIDRQSLDFGQVVWGETRSRHLFITNSGGQKIRFTKIARVATTTPPTTNLFDFEILRNINDLKDLRPGQTEEIIVEYTPSNPGENAAEMQLAFDDGSNKGDLSIQDVRIPMTGSGINPEIMVNPDELVFGTLVVDIQQEVLNATLSNPGTGSITVSAIHLEETMDTPFNLNSLLPPMPFSVDKNTPMEFGVRFQPKKEGDFEGKVIIETNDPNNPTLEVMLFGSSMNCEDACPLANAEQKCTPEGCEIEKCIGDFMDLDGDVMTGCECPKSSEMKKNDLCPAASPLPDQNGTDWGPFTIEGQIVEKGDEDWYAMSVTDDSFFGAEVGVKVSFMKDANTELWYCVYFSEEGSGSVCPPDAINGTQGSNCVGSSGSSSFKASQFISLVGDVRVNVFIRVYSPSPDPVLTCGSYFVTVQGY